MTTYNWTTPVSGDWLVNATDWTSAVPATAPNDATADVFIDSATAVTNTYTVAIAGASGTIPAESVTVNSLTLNDTPADQTGVQNAQGAPYGAILQLDGTLAFAPGSSGLLGGSPWVQIGPDANAEIINGGTINGFVQVEGNLLLTGTNGVYFADELQSNSGTITINTSSIAQITGSSLVGGIFEAKGAGAVINFGGSGNPVVNIGSIAGQAGTGQGWTQLSFNDPTAQINEWNGTAYVSVATTLNDIDSGGILNVLDGANYTTTTQTLTVDGADTGGLTGMLNLQAGTVSTLGITINGGLVQGYATIVGGVANDGTLMALGGKLDLTGSLTGTGVVDFDYNTLAGALSATGATLEVNSVTAGQTIVMNGDNTLQLDTPAAFAGTIVAKAGDTIVLQGVTATSAVLTNGSLIVSDGTTLVDTLTLSGTYTGDSISVSGSTIQIAAGTVAPTITGTAAGQAVTDQTTIKPFSNVVVADVIGQTETVTVTLSAPGNGILSNLGGGSYNATTGVYTYTGTAAAATAALDGVVFTPTAHQVAPGQTTTTTFSIGDTDTAGATVSDIKTTVIATAGTVVPTISGTALSQSTTDTATVKPFSGLSIEDLNAGQTETLTVALSAAANGALSNLGGGSYDAATGVYTDTGTAAAVTGALDALVFTPTAHQDAPGQTVTTTFTISDTDSAGAAASGATTSVVTTETANTSASALSPDILFQNQSGQMAQWTVSGSTIASGAYIGPDPGSSWFAMGTGAFYTGDTSDIVWQNANGAVALWQVQGTNVLGGSVVASNPGTSWHIKGTGDFYGDGNTDILWQNDNGSVALWDMQGASIVQGAVLAADPGPSWHIEGTGNFYGDGNTDILWQNDDGSVAIWDMSGTSIVQGAIVASNPGSTWHIKGTGDFYGDGNTDILWQNDNGSVAIWDMQGSTIAGGGIVAANPGPTWHIEGVGDFNNDGKTDIAWQNDNGSVAVWDMDGTNIVSGAVLANPGTLWSMLGGDENMRFIYSGSAGETLAAMPVTPEEFVFTNPAAGAHTISGFDVTQDAVELSSALFPSFADVQAATTATAAGALISLGSSSLFLAGVVPGSLHASNFALA